MVLFKEIGDTPGKREHFTWFDINHFCFIIFFSKYFICLSRFLFFRSALNNVRNWIALKRRNPTQFANFYFTKRIYFGVGWCHSKWLYTMEAWTNDKFENQKLISSNSFSPENCDSIFLINKTIIVEKLFCNSGNIRDACF